MRNTILLVKLLHLAVQFRLISQHHSFQNAVFRLLKHCLIDLPDPLLNEYHALALKLATKEEIEQIKAMAFRVNAVLKEYFGRLGVTLVDFKLEFGRTADGSIVLADEISPDTCRFWDAKTGEKLDKDRFRRDMGGVEDAYREMMRRVFGAE